MHSLWSAAVQYTNYGTGGAFELPMQSGKYMYIYNVWDIQTHNSVVLAHIKALFDKSSSA